MSATRRANARRLTAHQLLGAALLAMALPGCPISDHYYLDATAGRAGAGPMPSAMPPAMPPDCVPTPEVCDGVSNDCDAEVDEGNVCPAGCTARSYEHHVYVLCISADASTNLDYAAAGARCKGLGAELGLSIEFELSFIESSAENMFLKDWIMTDAPTMGAVWMGANDIVTEGTWVWGPAADAVEFYQGTSSGTRAGAGGRSGTGGGTGQGRYNDWGTGRPNSSTAAGEDCGTFDSAASWDWNDVSCTDAEVGFLCEETP